MAFLSPSATFLKASWNVFAMVILGFLHGQSYQNQKHTIEGTKMPMLFVNHFSTSIPCSNDSSHFLGFFFGRAPPLAKSTKSACPKWRPFRCSFVSIPSAPSTCAARKVRLQEILSRRLEMHSSRPVKCQGRKNRAKLHFWGHLVHL